MARKPKFLRKRFYGIQMLVCKYDILPLPDGNLQKVRERELDSLFIQRVVQALYSLELKYSHITVGNGFWLRLLAHSARPKSRPNAQPCRKQIRDIIMFSLQQSIEGRVNYRFAFMCFFRTHLASPVEYFRLCAYLTLHKDVKG